jgi:hypothetical protein
MELTQSKSLLAKLMATENLHIEQRNVSTASFDVENRILTIPVLNKEITNDQYDLFIGHEVGHALYTPLDGLKKAFEEKMSMSVLNVVEDSRIERKIKSKYPGLRQVFIRAYKDLVAKDFFGTQGQNLNALNFIDRINLYCKGGVDLGIQFTDEEKIILNEVENTITYDDVIAVTKKICDQMTEEEKNKPRLSNYDDFEYDEDGNEMASQESQKGDSEDTGESQVDDRKDSGEKSKDGKGDLNDKKGDSKEDEFKESETKGAAGQSGANSKTPVSHTDEAFRKNEHKLFSNDGRKYYYGNVPKLELDKIIVDHKVLWERYCFDVKTRLDVYGPSVGGTDKVAFQKLREESKKVVGYLVKEFELRKNAEQLKRASVAKTGELNMSKIFSYKFSEDIFKKISVVPNGKSHGLVMFIDWSGSMHNHIDNTIRQLLNLVMFCKKVNIPYDVYAFTQAYDKNARVHPKKDDMVLIEFSLMNLLSSRMSATEYSYAASALLAFHNRYSYKPSWFGLSGTPLNEAIVAAMEIVPKFRKENRLQIVNTVFLTDGDGQKSLNTYDYTGRWHNPKSATFVIRDPVTKHEEYVVDGWSRELTSAYIKLLKARTNAHVIGFYILSARDFGYQIQNFDDINPSDREEQRKKFRSNKYQVVTSEGYDEYYLLHAEGLETDDDAEFEVKENATTRGFVSAFTKFNNNRKANRVVLNRFIGLIT